MNVCSNVEERRFSAAFSFEMMRPLGSARRSQTRVNLRQAFGTILARTRASSPTPAPPHA
jgi:hypothetical protein